MRRVDGFTKEKAWSCTDRLWCDNQYYGSSSVWILDSVVAVGRLSPQLSGRGPCTQAGDENRLHAGRWEESK